MNKEIPMTLEEIKNNIGQNLWFMSIDRSFGGCRKVIKVTDLYIWDETDSYLCISDLGVKMNLYKNEPTYLVDEIEA